MKTSPKKVLIADDEEDILEIIGYNLRNENYEVITAKDGKAAIEKAKESKPDLIILDMMMPFYSGMQVCEILRSLPQFEDTLIVFLTAIDDDSNEIKGLESGADDYITKPISPKVLISRINALFRRAKKEDIGDKIIAIENMKIDPIRFVVTIDQQDVILAKKEFELLYLLASTPGRVFLRNEILNKVWGSEVIVGDRTIDVHIRKIRQKLNLDCISTVKGVGYKFVI
ncbi:response regulator [Arachidicoccus sp.]|uniref:response regulator n=1 Tax=Arachidicoccus sp. TaxID=1872624 RepID=UPI003D22DCE1